MRKISNELQEEVYAFLKENYYGEEKGCNAVAVANDFLYDNLNSYASNARIFRMICRAINQNPDLGFVSTSDSIYACKTEEEVNKAITNTWRTAITFVKKAQAMSNKKSKQGQYEFTENGQTIKNFI